MHARRVAAMFVGIAVDREIQKICADSAIVQQCISLARRAVSAHLRALVFAFDQKRQQLPFGLMNPGRKTSVAPDILKSNLPLVHKQVVDIRR